MAALTLMELQKRLVLHVHELTQQQASGQKAGNWGFTIRKLADKAGIGWYSARHYFVMRDVAMPLHVMDAVLQALGLELLDLMYPSEFCSYMDKAGVELRAQTRARLAYFQGKKKAAQARKDEAKRTLAGQLTPNS